MKNMYLLALLSLCTFSPSIFAEEENISSTEVLKKVGSMLSTAGSEIGLGVTTAINRQLAFMVVEMLFNKGKADTDAFKDDKNLNYK